MQDVSKSVGRTRVESYVESVLQSNAYDFKAFEEAAEQETRAKFGTARVLFNPIYLSNVCFNNCGYCAFRISNKGVRRKELRREEILREAEALSARGVNQILLLAGEYDHRKYGRMILRALRALKANFDFDWLGLELAPMSAKWYERFCDSGADAIICFQETYDKSIYETVHRGVGPKANFDYRLRTQFRAIKAGFTEVGVGVLLGLNSDWIGDMLSLTRHAVSLRATYPDLDLRFSFPRIKPWDGGEPGEFPQVSGKELMRCIVAMRLAFPSSTLVLTGRESEEFLLSAARFVNVLGKGGSTAVGGYVNKSPGSDQFELCRDTTFGAFRQRMLSQGYWLR